MIITGNKNKGLAQSLFKLYPNATFVSRESKIDLTKAEGQELFANECIKHDVIINCSALWKFNQTVLLDVIYKKCVEFNHTPHIIVIGSTTDRVKNGKAWLYNAEKKALRDYSNTLALGGVWDKRPKVSYISFGTLSNNQEKHPDRKCMNIDDAANYIKWLIDQPKYVNINEISIDPMQDNKWYE
jgi:NADP-dependent 3-hydroxy acid dehydrogenase YdfG